MAEVGLMDNQQNQSEHQKPIKTCFVLLRTLGDVVLLNTVVNNYKENNPDELITVFVNEQYMEIVLYNPNIHEVVTPPNWDYVLSEISKGTYDKVFVPYQTTPEDNIWHQVDKYRNQHLVDFYAERCGFKLHDKRLFMYPVKADYDDIEKIMSEIKPQREIVAIHTTTLVDSKNWEGFQELANELIKKYDVFQIGIDTDKKVEGCSNLMNIGINRTAAFLKRCKCFVGLDSGLSYVAAAVGIPTFVIMGMSIPTTSSPFGENVTHIVSDSRKDCERIRCHSSCRFNDPCIKKIKLERILATLSEHGI